MPQGETLKQEERAYVENALAGKVICERCRCTVDDYAERCAAPLGDPCPGFVAIAQAMLAFRNEIKTDV